MTDQTPAPILWEHRDQTARDDRIDYDYPPEDQWIPASVPPVAELDD